jgi:DNA-binding CsgD family transcriptional regulator
VAKSEGCWTWTGGTSGFGHGAFWDGERQEIAHRFSWRLHHGPIPDGIYVLHHCDNPPCVRPDHLFLGTQRDNIRDASAKGRIPRGLANGSGKVSIKDRAVIVARYRAGGVTQATLAEEYGVTQTMVSRYVRGVESHERP